MKRTTLLSLSLLFLSFASQAQISKGSTYLGGTIGFNQTKHKLTGTNLENSGSNIGLSLEFGKAVAVNRFVGVFASTTMSRTRNIAFGSNNRSESNEYGGGAFFRRYFNLSQKWYLFGNASLEFFSGTSENKLNGAKVTASRGWGTGIYVTPGISYAAGKRLFIETGLGNLLSIGYNRSTNREYSGSTVINSQKSSQAFAEANLSGFSNIVFGLRWILPG